ncbi:hypothetical protein G3N95_00825 [Paraburkholderia sp. Tr-20389]|uniref:hypothetical protein n=1 Tax=Paraburkholderia sp. Tr-20389 TaxID=2703903 RepID=UPI00197E8183|nr:hypothetical protein [Paraburkholderia sp. Tr-20389]MBN3751467.1 hypothetical protein [Paraburkholderia sp. Tr-20389]
MNTNNCRQTAVNGYAAQPVQDGRARARSVPRDQPSTTVEQIKETAGVVLAAVFTIIAGAGTVLQLVAFLR